MTSGTYGAGALLLTLFLLLSFLFLFSFPSLKTGHTGSDDIVDEAKLKIGKALPLQLSDEYICPNKLDIRHLGAQTEHENSCDEDNVH